VITSTDNVEWRTRQTGADYHLMDVAWAGGLFVAVGQRYGWEGADALGVIVTSEDGVDWVERYRRDGRTLEAVLWTGSRFVAVGIGNEVVLSPDGLSWSEHQVAPEGWSMTDLAWNGSKLAAIGTDNVMFGDWAVFTSDDGDEWQVQNIECEHCYLHSIAAIGCRFVVVGPWRKTLVSDDGTTWSEAPYDALGSFDLIVAGGDRLFAMGYEIAGTSFDGYTWSIEHVPVAKNINGLAWDGAGYLAVGEDGFMMSSTDGTEWKQHSSNTFGSRGSAEIDELVKGGSTIVGVGAGIVTGRHGTDWVWRSTPGDVRPRSVIWTGSAFWAAGENGVIRSGDGVFWSPALVDHELRLYDIVWNGSVFVAVGWNPSSGDGRNLILTSPDGLNWTYHWIERDYRLRAVGWTGSLFVVAGGGSDYLTSADGEIWQVNLRDDNRDIVDMAWNGDRLVAVGGWGFGGLILSTTDGIHWEKIGLPVEEVPGFDDVTWTGTHFVAVSRSSGDLVFTSTNGLTWTSEITGTGVWPVSVVGDERNLFVTGRGLQIIRRTTPLADTPVPRRPDRRVEPVGDKVRVGPAVEE
jgi:hypothetical protein